MPYKDNTKAKFLSRHSSLVKTCKTRFIIQNFYFIDTEIKRKLFSVFSRFQAPYSRPQQG